MREAWKAWEGRVVNREFRLGDYLGGSERAGVFTTQYGPDSRKAAVKLIRIGDWDQATAEAELARLQSARELSHPYLIQLLQAGRTRVDDSELLFVVMEYAGEDLSQILPNRALAGEEVREMLTPMIEALAYVHGKGLVHGHLKPANVMAIGDQLKLSSDGISRSGAPRIAGEQSEYDAPEIARGENSAASDIWSLGMLLVTALTQQLPDREANGQTPLLPGNLPGRLDDLARNCLQREPRARWTLAEIATHAGVAVQAPSVTVSKPESRQSAAASGASARPQLVPPVAKASREARPFPYQRRSNTGAYVAVAVVLVIVSALVVPRLFRRGALNAKSGDSQAANLHKEPAAQKRPKASSKAQATNSRIAQVNDSRATGDASTTTKSEERAETPAKVPVTRETALRRGLTAGEVAEQVVPDVPESARKTIHGTVRVGVRVSVDSSGSVTEAELDSPGPSKYFAQLALAAAQQWKFDPPKMEGRNVLSDWLLHFQFTGQGTKVIPVQSDP